MGRRPASKPTASLQLKPADPFELIRWLARSQSDPRKAVAELVQNSLDAGARHVDVHRRRVRGEVCLVVCDDGEGVLPEMEREPALKYLATHVGHSRKMGLSVAQRAQVVGKYGVGLLGFWCVGHELEIRTRVNGSPLFALKLIEDSDRAEILGLPLDTDSLPTFTEVVVTRVHEAALAPLGGRRLTDYLAAELRGQLIAKSPSLIVHDHVARGTAQKRFEVLPRRFSGEPLRVSPELDVPGFAQLRVDLYLARGAQRPAITVECAGTLVADDIAELAALGLATEPWVGRELTGLVDFASFTVPPGTRRGVVPDRAATAFVEAMQRLEPEVTAELERLDVERRAALDRSVLDQLKRALRGFRRRLPQYDLPHVVDGEAPGDGLEEGAPLSAGSAPRPRVATMELFPAGPLAGLAIAPDPVEIAPGAERRVRAAPVDADGRAVEVESFSWSVDDPRGIGLSIRGEGPRPALALRPDAREGDAATLRVVATSGELTASAAAAVAVVPPPDEAGSLGIPEPHLVSDADGLWRSRMLGDRWEVNDAHEDYRALRADARARVRYLLSLLAREIVLRSRSRPEEADALDAVVEILAHAERNLRGG
ncbi:MAG: ATP-binding protein [Deltaproteobacteria bacterium]|nr:ATP-binding protein [Deltaproteobacteria bacterium]